MADKIRVLLPEEEVDRRINEVAEEINRDYAGKAIHLICILKGGVFFTCELAKRITNLFCNFTYSFINFFFANHNTNLCIHNKLLIICYFRFLIPNLLQYNLLLKYSL